MHCHGLVICCWASPEVILGFRPCRVHDHIFLTHETPLLTLACLLLTAVDHPGNTASNSSPTAMHVCVATDMCFTTKLPSNEQLHDSKILKFLDFSHAATITCYFFNQLKSPASLFLLSQPIQLDFSFTAH
jgi:hypothetical protein